MFLYLINSQPLPHHSQKSQQSDSPCDLKHDLDRAVCKISDRGVLRFTLSTCLLGAENLRF